MNDIEIDVGKSKSKNESESNSTNGRRGGGSKRTPIYVKGDYGTERYGTETTCHKCSTRAVGIIIIDSEITPPDEMTVSYPLCSKHRDEIKTDKSRVWEESEFRRFIDDN